MEKSIATTILEFNNFVTGESKTWDDILEEFFETKTFQNMTSYPEGTLPIRNKTTKQKR